MDGTDAACIVCIAVLFVPLHHKVEKWATENWWRRINKYG